MVLISGCDQIDAVDAGQCQVLRAADGDCYRGWSILAAGIAYISNVDYAIVVLVENSEELTRVAGHIDGECVARSNGGAPDRSGIDAAAVVKPTFGIKISHLHETISQFHSFCDSVNLCSTVAFAFRAEVLFLADS